MIVDQLVVSTFSWDKIWFLGAAKSNLLSPDLVQKFNTKPYLILLTYLYTNSVFHAFKKHIKINFHFVRDMVTQKLIKVQFVFAKDQPAYIFIKPVSGQICFTLGLKLNVLSPAFVRETIDKSKTISQTRQDKDKCWVLDEKESEQPWSGVHDVFSC